MKHTFPLTFTYLKKGDGGGKGEGGRGREKREIVRNRWMIRRPMSSLPQSLQ